MVRGGEDMSDEGEPLSEGERGAAVSVEGEVEEVVERLLAAVRRL